MYLPENGKQFDISKILVPRDSWSAGSQKFRGDPFYHPKETYYSGEAAVSDWVCGPLSVYIPLRFFGFDVSVGQVADVVRQCGGNDVIGTPNWVIASALSHFGVETAKLNIESSLQLKPFLGNGWLAILNVWEVNEGSLEGPDRMGDGHIMVALSVDESGQVLAADPTFRPQNDGVERAYGLVTLTKEGLRRRHFDFSCGCGINGNDVSQKCDHDYYKFWANDKRTVLTKDAVWEHGATILVKRKGL